MRTYDPNAVHIEQCETCRGIFLDFGEVEHLLQLENRFTRGPPPAPGHAPAWGTYGGHKYRKKGVLEPLLRQLSPVPALRLVSRSSARCGQCCSALASKGMGVVR